MKLYDIFVILKLLCISLCKACKPAEYKIDKECCPMCAAGTHVSKHCDRELGTNCIPCIGSTYTNVPNGLSSCFTCTVCDEGHGLKVKKKCESVSDAVCEPLPRYYCIDDNNGSCRKAREHSTCLPGQYINQTGTALKDTVCSDCPEETYSDGSFTRCKLHTTCGSLWQKTITQGTRSSDAHIKKARKDIHKIQRRHTCEFKSIPAFFRGKFMKRSQALKHQCMPKIQLDDTGFIHPENALSGKGKMHL